MVSFIWDTKDTNLTEAESKTVIILAEGRRIGRDWSVSRVTVG
jgi:hypothetical protein